MSSQELPMNRVREAILSTIEERWGESGDQIAYDISTPDMIEDSDWLIQTGDLVRVDTIENADGEYRVNVSDTASGTAIRGSMDPADGGVEVEQKIEIDAVFPKEQIQGGEKVGPSRQPSKLHYWCEIRTK